MCAKVSKVQIKKIESKNKKKVFNKNTLKTDKFKNKTEGKVNGVKHGPKGSKNKKGNDPRIKEIYEYKPKVPFDPEKNRPKILKILDEALRMPDYIKNGMKSAKKGDESKKEEPPVNEEVVETVEPAQTEPASPKKKKNKKKKTNASDKNEEIPKVQEDSKKSENVVTEDKKAEPKKTKSSVENTVFVGNIPANTKKVQLMKLFAKCGKVVSVRFRTLDGKRLFKHKIRKDAQALNAYVVLEGAKAIEKALALSGTEFKGNHIRVDRAKGKDGRQVELKSVQEEKLKSKRTVFVGNLKYSVTDEKLHEIFSSCGEVEYVRTIQSEKGCKGIAYVCFKKPESVTLALELNNTLVDDRPMRVERCSKEKSDKLKEQKAKMNGAPRRLMEKKKKNDAQNQKQKQTNKNKKATDDEEKKKAPFKGVKSDKVKKNKKKKKMPEALKLAKKLSPGMKKPKPASED